MTRNCGLPCPYRQFHAGIGGSVAPYGASRFAVTTALSLLPLLCRRAAVAPYHLCQLSSLITDRASLMSNSFTLIG